MTPATIASDDFQCIGFESRPWINQEDVDLIPAAPLSGYQVNIPAGVADEIAHPKPDGRCKDFERRDVPASTITKKLHEQFHGNLILTGLDNDVNRKKIKRGPGKQGIKGKHFLLAKEIKYIQERAAEQVVSGFLCVGRFL